MGKCTDSYMCCYEPISSYIIYYPIIIIYFAYFAYRAAMGMPILIMPVWRTILVGKICKIISRRV